MADFAIRRGSHAILVNVLGKSRMLDLEMTLICCDGRCDISFIIINYVVSNIQVRTRHEICKTSLIKRSCEYIFC